MAIHLRRRQLLALPVGACLSMPQALLAHGAAGRVEPPLPVPAAAVIAGHGQRVPLASLLAGRCTAVQLIFTGCSATCPIQGALFADAARELRGRDRSLQLLSLSIDPLGDSAPALLSWQRRFMPDVPPHWQVAVPVLASLDPLMDFLQGRATGPDRHTRQVYYFDRSGRLLLRSTDFPPAAEIVQQLGFIERARA
jgi:protein SCO1